MIYAMTQLMTVMIMYVCVHMCNKNVHLGPHDRIWSAKNGRIVLPDNATWIQIHDRGM